MLDFTVFRTWAFVILALSASGASADAPAGRGKPHLPQDVNADSPTSEERARMVEQLWLTPLGKMFSHFLFDVGPNEAPAELSRKIVDRIHSDVKLTITRMSALNLMIENLYDAAKLTPNVHDRIMLLETGLALKRQVLQNTAAREFFRFLPIFVGLGFLGGSPLVRENLGAALRDVWQMIKLAVRGQSVAATKSAFVTHVRPDAFFTKNILNGWSPGAAYLTLWHSFGTSYLFYYVFRTGSADSMAVQNKVWVYGIQRFVSFDEI